ncbi:MAG: hypothetical protein ACP5JU_02960, partial [Minisyncoccia bacterium]
REFWNGALKASIMIEKDLKKLLKEAGPEEQKGINIALERVKEIKEGIETLHGNTLMKRLKEIESEEE